MNRIFKRVGMVLYAAIVGAVGGTIVAFLFGFVKALSGSGGAVSLTSASVVGIGWFGAIGAIAGALMGKDAVEGDGQQSSRAGDVAAWIVAVMVAIMCLSILYGR
jgi:hypothetical protein